MGPDGHADVWSVPFVATQNSASVDRLPRSSLGSIPAVRSEPADVAHVNGIVPGSVTHAWEGGRSAVRSVRLRRSGFRHRQRRAPPRALPRESSLAWAPLGRPFPARRLGPYSQQRIGRIVNGRVAHKRILGSRNG